MKTTSLVKAAVAGVAGAAVTTGLNELLKHKPQSPRLDLLGQESLAKTSQTLTGAQPDDLYTASMAGDLFANGSYFGLAGMFGADHALATGAVLGLLAGFGSVVLPGRLGLDNSTTDRTPTTQGMTVCFYTAGGLVAGLVYNVLAD